MDRAALCGLLGARIGRRFTVSRRLSTRASRTAVLALGVSTTPETGVAPPALADVNQAVALQRGRVNSTERSEVVAGAKQSPSRDPGHRLDDTHPSPAALPGHVPAAGNAGVELGDSPARDRLGTWRTTIPPGDRRALLSRIMRTPQV